MAPNFKQTNQIKLTSEFEIHHGGIPIGHIEPLGVDNHIIGHIEIKEDKQGNGYGKQATRLFLKRAKKRGVGTVSTSVIISSCYEHILRNHFGFEETALEEAGLYLAKDLTNFPTTGNQ